MGGRTWLAVSLTLAGVLVGNHLIPTRSASAAHNGASELLGIADLVEELAPSVVGIQTETHAIDARFFDNPHNFRLPPGLERGMPFQGRSPRQRGAGSGFIVDEDGFVLTNWHVVKDANDIQVTMNDGEKYEGKVVGKDPLTDLALVKIKPKGKLKAVRLGNSGATRVGDWVMALGSPFGLTQSLSVGVVSAKGRHMNITNYDDLIQTDAAINPGNSGGPLFNLRGDVIGINTARVAEGDNVGFAIPVDLARDLIPQLKKNGFVVRGWLGVQIQDLTKDIAQSLGLETSDGALIARVDAGSPAESAGVQRGDVITKWDGKDIRSANDLSRAVAATPPDAKTKIVVMRDAAAKTLKVSVGRMEQDRKVSARDGADEKESPSSDRFGLALRELGNGEGLLVLDVEAGSAAEKSGIEAGDVILEVGRKPVNTVDDFKKGALAQGNRPSMLLVQRANAGVVYLALKAPTAQGKG